MQHSFEEILTFYDVSISAIQNVGFYLFFLVAELAATSDYLLSGSMLLRGLTMSENDGDLEVMWYSSYFAY